MTNCEESDTKIAADNRECKDYKLIILIQVPEEKNPDDF
jgi:hypothetical protein